MRSRALRRWQDPAAALAHADWLIAHLPEAAAIAEHERAQCFADMNHVKDAIVAYGKTLDLPFRLPGATRFNEAIRRWAEAFPNDDNVQRFAAAHRRREGI
jgi:hypothetical protein